MYKNNFDCSSTGLNIEVSACYDSSMSQSIFDDIYRVVRNNRREPSLLIRTYDFDGDSPDKVVEVGKFVSGKQGPMSKELIVDILNEYSEYSYDTESFTYEELKEELNNIDIKYLPEILEDYRDFFKLNEDLSLYTSRGYCQGDIGHVLCKADNCKNYWNLIDHELWDCPVSARVTISGCEYDYYDFECDMYDWQKEKFVDAVVKAHTNNLELQEKLKKQLMVMLPDNLEVL